ncbi:hypothetical protein [Roseimicrobium gellanilyticum]|uniref:hypothetical protein n=1 Tax=Roseimicrobium gellanilyticum TaxID=748857 RepID=UPI0014736318|nr:hypothetical protein [Roseimicrobium gellanilyticum]
MRKSWNQGMGRLPKSLLAVIQVKKVDTATDGIARRMPMAHRFPDSKWGLCCASLILAKRTTSAQAGMPGRTVSHGRMKVSGKASFITAIKQQAAGPRSSARIQARSQFVNGSFFMLVAASESRTACMTNRSNCEIDTPAASIDLLDAEGAYERFAVRQ